MAELLLVNVEEHARDDEVGAFLTRYGFPLFDSIERVPAGIGNPIALLRFSTLSSVALYVARTDRSPVVAGTVDSCAYPAGSEGVSGFSCQRG